MQRSEVRGRWSVVRFTTGRALVVTALIAACTVAMTCTILGIGTARSSAFTRPAEGGTPNFDIRAYVRTWNDLAESINKQNPLLDELQQSVKAGPPWRVRDARRDELWDQIIAEHERQLADFKKLRAAER